jgi:hypothetical protein
VVLQLLQRYFNGEDAVGVELYAFFLRLYRCILSCVPHSMGLHQRRLPFLVSSKNTQPQRGHSFIFSGGDSVSRVYNDFKTGQRGL